MLPSLLGLLDLLEREGLAHPRLVWLPLLDALPNELALVWPRDSAHLYLSLLLQETRRAAVSGTPTPDGR